jgi:hypothetical protein
VQAFATPICQSCNTTITKAFARRFGRELRSNVQYSQLLQRTGVRRRALRVERWPFRLGPTAKRRRDSKWAADWELAELV